MELLSGLNDCFVVRLPCFHYGAPGFVVVRRSLGHALYVRSLLHGFHASPTEKYAALIVAASFRNSAAVVSGYAGRIF